MLYEQVIERGKAHLTDTSAMSRSEWLKLRASGIGGSDAGAIMGLNKYATPLSVYFAKKDLAVQEGSKAAEWGNILEDPVRQKAREELGIQIETVPGMFTNKEHDFMNANFDGLVFVEGEKEIAGSVVSGLGGHEIKTSRTGEGFTTDEIPDSYYAQVQQLPGFHSLCLPFLFSTNTPEDIMSFREMTSLLTGLSKQKVCSGTILYLQMLCLLLPAMKTSLTL